MNTVEEVIEERSTYVGYQELTYCIPCGMPLRVTRTNLSARINAESSLYYGKQN